MGAGDFLITFGGEVGDDKVSFFGEEEKAVFVGGDEDGAPAGRAFEADGLEGFPDAFSGIELEAAEFSVTTRSVDIAIVDVGGVDDRIEMGGAFFAAARALPQRCRSAVVIVHLEEERAVVEIGEEEFPVVRGLGGGDGEAGADIPGESPDEGARLRIERVDCFRVPDEKEPFPGVGDDSGWAIARLYRGEGAPVFFSGELIEGDCDGAFAVCEADELVSINERGPGVAQVGVLALKMALKSFSQRRVPSVTLRQARFPSAPRV